MRNHTSGLRLIIALAVAALLGIVFTINSVRISSYEDYRESNFAKFWVAGHMVLSGQNPYDADQWRAAQLDLGSTWIPDLIFLYPLPQAFLVAPLALLPPAQSFVVWGVVSQLVIAASCLALLRRSKSVQEGRLFVPLILLLLFFGPVYLSLQVGSIGAIALAVLVGSIFLLDRNRSLLAGIVLSLLMLKPPQGLPILLLLGFWFILRKDSKAILGLSGGSVILLVAGLIYDPFWISKFVTNSQIVSGRTLGAQSNLWSLSFFMCRQNGGCTLATGILLTGLILVLGAWILWRLRHRLGAWETMNIIIPVASICAAYVYAYDQIVFIIPITWAAGRLVARTRSYVPTFVYLIGLDLLTLAFLFVQATTQRDNWSAVTAVLVLAMSLGLVGLDRPRPVAPELAA